MRFFLSWLVLAFCVAASVACGTSSSAPAPALDASPGDAAAPANVITFDLGATVAT